jgi:hypothetical protein
MNYTIKNLEELTYTENLIYDLKNALPECKLYNIDITYFINIAYNNVITQLNIIMENDNKPKDIIKSINTNNVTNYFYRMFLFLYSTNLRYLYKKLIHTYGDVLKDTTKLLYERLFEDIKKIKTYIVI